jgi:hypothetical protein
MTRPQYPGCHAAVADLVRMRPMPSSTLLAGLDTPNIPDGHHGFIDLVVSG